MRAHRKIDPTALWTCQTFSIGPTENVVPPIQHVDCISQINSPQVLVNRLASASREHLVAVYRYQGRDFRLTDVHDTVVKAIWADNSTPHRLPTIHSPPQTLTRRRTYLTMSN